MMQMRRNCTIWEAELLPGPCSPAKPQRIGKTALCKWNNLRNGADEDKGVHLREAAEQRRLGSLLGFLLCVS